MQHWPRLREEGRLEDLLVDPPALRYWTTVFDAVAAGRIDSWAYRWTLSCWLHSGLTALPECNLVSNIGFDDAATHTSDPSLPGASLATSALGFPLRHPYAVLRDLRADRLTQRRYFEGGGVWTGMRRRLRGLFVAPLRA
jgi:hypothetical protein